MTKQLRSTKYCGAALSLNIQLHKERCIYIITHHSNNHNDGTLYQYVKKCFHTANIKGALEKAPLLSVLLNN